MAIPGGYLIKTYYSEGCCSNKIHETAGRALEAYGKASETAGMTWNSLVDLGDSWVSEPA